MTREGALAAFSVPAKPLIADHNCPPAWGWLEWRFTYQHTIGVSIIMPGVSATDETPCLKAVALSKLKCQVEELQQHNTHLTADNQGLRQKITALQQVGVDRQA